MKCKEVLLEIIPYINGEIDLKKLKEYKRHINLCRDCARTSFKIQKVEKFIKKHKKGNNGNR